jgi:hypothetical protein
MSQLDCPSNDDLRRLIEQQLDVDTKSKLETHVQSCPKCQIVVVTLSNDAQHRDLSGDFVSAGPTLKKSSQIDLSNLDDSFARSTKACALNHENRLTSALKRPPSTVARLPIRRRQISHIASASTGFFGFWARVGWAKFTWPRTANCIVKSRSK